MPYTKSRNLFATSLLVCAPLVAQTYTFETFGVKHPNAPHLGTYSQGMSSNGAAAGYLIFGKIDPRTGQTIPVEVGFRRYTGGAIEYPIVVPDDYHSTQAEGINSAGTIVGRFRDPSGTYTFHGFMLSNGAYTVIDEGGGPNTWIQGINNAGTFVGSFGSQVPPEHGFIDQGGVLTQVDVPGAPATLANAIAADGTVVGCTGFPDNLGFIRGPKGNYVVFQAPQAYLTCALGINNASTMIVGYYIDDQNAHMHGFVYNYSSGFGTSGPGGIVTLPVVTVDYPGADVINEVTGVDAEGKIVGLAQFTPPAGALPAFGFIGTPVK